MKYTFLVIVFFLVAGCVKPSGNIVDTSLIKEAAVVKEASDIAAIKDIQGEINGIKEAVGIKAESIKSDFAAFTKHISETLNSNQSAGRDSVMNDPKMVVKIVLLLCLAISLPQILLILLLMFTLKSLISNISDSMDKLIEKLDWEIEKGKKE